MGMPKKRKLVRRGMRESHGIHCIDTEVRDFDTALGIIARDNRAARTRGKRKSNPPTLKQLFAQAKGRDALKALHKKRTPAQKLPHPFRDLHPNDKAAKVREMYDHGHGHWGFGPVAYRRLAALFGVPVGVIVVWTEED